MGRPSHQGQGRRKRGEMGQGGEEGRGGEGTDGGEEFGVRKQVREGGGRGAGGQTELPKRRRRRRREWRPSSKWEHASLTGLVVVQGDGCDPKVVFIFVVGVFL